MLTKRVVITVDIDNVYDIATNLHDYVGLREVVCLHNVGIVCGIVDSENYRYLCSIPGVMAVNEDCIAFTI